METLAIECSAEIHSLCLWNENDQLLGEASYQSERHRQAQIFESLPDLLAIAKPRRVIVGLGPGSYGGVRVAIAVAEGIRVATQAELVGLPSVFADRAQEKVDYLIGNARRGSWYRMETRGVSDCGEVELMPFVEFQQWVEGALAEGKRLGSLESVDELEMDTGKIIQVRPEARGLYAAWNGLGDEDRQALGNRALEPIYLRPPHITPAKIGHPLLAHSKD